MSEPTSQTSSQSETISTGEANSNDRSQSNQDPSTVAPKNPPAKASSHELSDEGSARKQAPEPIALVGESKISKETYLASSKLSVQLPENMVYRPLDIDERVTGLYGQNERTGSALSMLTYPGDATPELAMGFLRESSESMPNLRGKRVTEIGAAQQLPPMEGSGLRGGQLWSGKLASGEQVHILLLRRSDGAGSYMMVMTGSPADFDNNEERYEAFYRSIKAQPAR